MNGKKRKSYNPFKRERRYVTLNFVTTYGTQNGYPKFDVLLNDQEKDYIEAKHKDKAVLFRRSVKEDEREENRDFEIVLDILESLNEYYDNLSENRK